VADDTYDVFVSYSRADGRHAEEIDSVLRDKGLKTFFDRRNLAAGLPWVRALEQAIGAAKAAIVLIGPPAKPATGRSGLRSVQPVCRFFRVGLTPSSMQRVPISRAMLGRGIGRSVLMKQLQAMCCYSMRQPMKGRWGR
jgi:TIR domain